MKIVMYGSGAAGSVFASYLKNGGADMILIDRYGCKRRHDFHHSSE